MFIFLFKTTNRIQFFYLSKKKEIEKVEQKILNVLLLFHSKGNERELIPNSKNLALDKKVDNKITLLIN